MSSYSAACGFGTLANPVLPLHKEFNNTFVAKSKASKNTAHSPGHHLRKQVVVLASDVAVKNGRLHPNSQWPTGIPPEMGGHRMPSGMYAPTSVSKGSGTGERHMFQYQDPVTDADVVIFEDSLSAGKGFSRFVVEASVKAIRERGIFTIALAGPETSLALANIASMVHAEDFKHWHVFFASEKCSSSCLGYPETADNCIPEETNFTLAKEAFLSKVSIPANQVYAPLEGASADKTAFDYETKLRYLPSKVPRVGNFPQLDLIVLDLEKDGSVASLLPNRKEVAVKDSCVVGVSRVPRGASERISFTMPLINTACQVAIIACGEEKASIVGRVLECQALPGALPAQLLAPTEKLVWVLDKQSSKELEVSTWEDWKMWPRSNVPKPAKK
mmetsp:Transcript_20723/g.28691  ORF Transcript_20723/g.28691 Transcript_20723/m.28691 type:complete len:388 (+) Transcript_20723:44-1207(+)